MYWDWLDPLFIYRAFFVYCTADWRALQEREVLVAKSLNIFFVGDINGNRG